MFCVSSKLPILGLLLQKLPTGLPGGLLRAVLVMVHSCTDFLSKAVQPLGRVPRSGESNLLVALAEARQPAFASLPRKFSDMNVEAASSAVERAEVPLKRN